MHLHCVIKGRVLVEEPKHAVVRLGVNALLSERANLIRLPSQDVELQHLEEGVAVLGCELDGKIQVTFRIFVLKVAILSEIGHRDAGTLAPDLTGFGNLAQCLVKGPEAAIEIFF